MVQSGLIQTDARLNNITGVTVELPFFAPLNYNEEVLDSSATWGDQGKGVLTWQKTKLPQLSTACLPTVRLVSPWTT